MYFRSTTVDNSLLGTSMDYLHRIILTDRRHDKELKVKEKAIWNIRAFFINSPTRNTNIVCNKFYIIKALKNIILFSSKYHSWSNKSLWNKLLHLAHTGRKIERHFYTLSSCAGDTIILTRSASIKVLALYNRCAREEGESVIDFPTNPASARSLRWKVFQKIV